MDDTIKALISIDERAREAVRLAKERRTSAKAEIAKEKSSVYHAYLQRAQEHISKMKEHAETDAAQQQLSGEKSFRESAAALEEQYNQNKEKWIQEIVCHCKEV